MGVSGSGKSTLARYIAEQIGANYLEADDYHPPENIALMRGGTPLTDTDREPWIQALCRKIKPATSNIVMAYSGLKYEHRRRFQELGKPCLFLKLNISRNGVEARLARRAGHFMPSSLIASQFESLEAIRSNEPVKEIDSDVNLEQVQRAAMKHVESFMAAPELFNSSYKTENMRVNHDDIET